MGKKQKKQTLVTVMKSGPKNTDLTPSMRNNILHNGLFEVELMFGKSIVCPFSKIYLYFENVWWAILTLHYQRVPNSISKETHLFSRHKFQTVRIRSLLRFDEQCSFEEIIISPCRKTRRLIVWDIAVFMGISKTNSTLILQQL